MKGKRGESEYPRAGEEFVTSFSRKICRNSKKFLTIWRFTAENWEIKKIISSTSTTNERERWHKIINPINLIFSYNAFPSLSSCLALPLLAKEKGK